MLNIAMTSLKRYLEDGKYPLDILRNCRMVFTAATGIRNQVAGQNSIKYILNIAFEMAHNHFEKENYLVALEACYSGSCFAASIGDVKSVYSLQKIKNDILKTKPDLKNKIKELERVYDDWMNRII
jgi:hypothetical protein